MNQASRRTAVIVKTVKTMTGKVTTIETTKFNIKVSTAKEGFFKKPSTVILIPISSERFGVKPVGKLIYTPSLDTKARYQVHDVVCNILNEDGQSVSLYDAIESLINNLNQKGLINEGINLADVDNSEPSKYAGFLNGVSFTESSKNMAAMCLALMEDAKSKRCDFCMKKEILEAQTSFVTNPCFNTAVRLLEVDPSSASLFIQNGDTAMTEDEWLFAVRNQDIQSGQ